MKPLRFFPGALVLLATTAFSQPPDTLWSRLVPPPGDTYPPWEECRPYDVKTTRAGSFLIGGGTWYTIPGGPSYGAGFAALLDSEGTIVWRVAVRQMAEIRSVAIAPDGGFMLFGSSGLSVTLCKLDSGGTVLWCDSCYGDVHANAKWIEPVPEGGFVLAGQRFGSPAGPFLAAVDDLGDTLWTHVYADSGWGGAFCVKPVTSGGYVAVGLVNRNQPANFPYLLKTDRSGNLSWMRTYEGGSGLPRFNFLIELPDQQYLTCGSIGGTSAVVRIDTLGEVVWSRPVPYPADRLAATRDSGAVITQLYSYAADPHLRRIDNAGNVLWQWLNPLGNIFYGAVDTTSDGGYVVSGQLGSQAVVIRLGPDPALRETDRRRAVAFSTELFSFPNPFNLSTTISFSLPREGRARIAMFDILGREVAVLADNVFTAGEHRIMFDGSSLPSGLYFARLQSGNMQATHKLLLMK